MVRRRALFGPAGQPRAGRRRGRAGRLRGTRDAPEGRAEAGRRAVRLHPDRLSAVAVAADPERFLRRARRDHPDAVRVLRARRPVRPGQHDQESARQLQHRPADHRTAARDVRSAGHARPAGLGATRAALRRQGVPHGDPAQRAPGRGPQLRLARPRVRPAGQGRARLSRIRRRADRTRPRNRRSPPRPPPPPTPRPPPPQAHPPPQRHGPRPATPRPTPQDDRPR